jgi:hypothetical protein
MPVYEIVRERPPDRPRISFADREIAEVGDVVTIDGSAWAVVLKEPPFAERRIERITCKPVP